MSDRCRKSLFPPEELRLILLGNLGCGKTLSGDTILGQASAACPSPSGSSRVCQLRRGMAEGRRVAVVEAPRWYWSGGHMEADVRRETERALLLTSPGPHAVLLLVPVGQFTEVERRVPAELEEVFGEGVLTQTLVLLTCGDYLTGRGEEQYMKGEDPGLREVIDRCGGRYHVINNRRPQEREQVRTLLEKVESMVEENGGCFLQSALQREVEDRVKEKERELREKYRVRVEVNGETVNSSHAVNAETERHGGRGEKKGNPGGGGGGGGNGEEEVEESATVPAKVNGLHSRPSPQTEHGTPNGGVPQVRRNSSFRLTEESTLLSELSEEIKPTEKVVSTFHHRIISGDKTLSPPETSPSSPVSTHNTLSLHNSSPCTSLQTSPQLTPSPSPSSASKPSSSTSPSCPSQATELRLVLLGRSGSGKSTVGNIILGEEVFASQPDGPKAVLQGCEKRRAQVVGRQVAVVDTPDWIQSESPLEEVQAQILSCVALATPGPHAFLFCVPLHRPPQDELEALGALEAAFGPEAVSMYTLVLFTHSDRLAEKAGPAGVEGYIASQRKDLLELVERCGDRYHVLERGKGGVGQEETGSVVDLLEKVEQMVKEGGGGCYACPIFQEAEDRVRRRQEELVTERRGRRDERGGGGRRGGGEGPEEVDRRVLYPYLQTLRETEEEDEVEDEIERAREEAEKSVSAMAMKSLPPLSSSSSSSSSVSPSKSLLRSLLEKVGCGAKRVPKLLAGGALLGGVLGVFLGGPLGGAVGAATGSVVTEVGRRRFSRKKTPASDTGTLSVTETEEAVDGGMEGLGETNLVKSERENDRRERQ